MAQFHRAFRQDVGSSLVKIHYNLSKFEGPNKDRPDWYQPDYSRILYLLFKWATLVAKVPEFPCLSLLHCSNIIMLLEVHCINMNTLPREMNILNFLQKVNSLEIKINWEYLNVNEYEKRKKIPDMKGKCALRRYRKGRDATVKEFTEKKFKDGSFFLQVPHGQNTTWWFTSTGNMGCGRASFWLLSVFQSEKWRLGKQLWVIITE